MKKFGFATIFAIGLTAAFQASPLPHRPAWTIWAGSTTFIST